MKTGSMLCFALAFAAALTARAVNDYPSQAKRITDNMLRQIERVPDGGVTGEQTAWNWNYTLGNEILPACETFQTDTWMAPTEKILNAMADKMSAGPDGYKGFIGPNIYDGKLHCDVHVGDSILIDHMLRFAMIVKDNPKLQKKYGKSAARFIEIAKKDLIEKWNKRGTFATDGPFACYLDNDLFRKAGEKEFFQQKEDNKRSRHALPFNKSLDMASCLLRLYYLTGDKQYRDDAEKICNKVKASMNRFQNAYTWNYSEPFSRYDVYPKGEYNRLTHHWVDTHPYRDYQAGEVSKMVLAYNMGVTFTREDMQRLVNTNLKLMWNGDKKNPKFVNSNAKLPGYRKPAPSKAYPTTAGCLWSALAQFDPTIRELAEKSIRPNDVISKAAMAKLCKNPPSYTRKYFPDAKVEDFPWMKGIKESGGQMFAVAIPSVVEPGKDTAIYSKALKSPRENVDVFVRPLNGGTEHKLFSRKIGDSAFFLNFWDGKINGKRTPGEYVIIWRYNGGERAYPVTIK